MDNRICYLNTDLDLKCADSLTQLGEVFEANGFHALHVTQGDDGLWLATFETEEQFAEPETNIAVMLDLVESLSGTPRETWNRCLIREFNIGYDCGIEPWAFNQSLSTELLGRLATVGASLRLTLYPDREPTRQCS